MASPPLQGGKGRLSKIVVTGTRGIPNVMGGVETHCEELFPRIVKLGFDVTLIRRDKYVHDGLTEWNGVKLVDVASPNKKAFEAIVHTWRAIWKAKHLGADTVHIHAIGPAMLAPLARLLGMKVVFTHHGPDYDRDKWGFAAKTMLKFGERMGCTFANDVIVISDVIRNLIARKYGRTKGVHLIYNGVPEPEICEYPEYFDELGIEKGMYILGMCRFVPEKRLHDLIAAWKKIFPQPPLVRGGAPNPSIPQHGDATPPLQGGRGGSPIKLVLAGDTDFEDDYSRKLKQMAKDNGVVLTGFVKGKKLHSLLTNCRCYCLPSSHEGLPIALLEAMSYSVPVIVSDIPANLEVGLDQKDYFPMGDVDALAGKMKAVITAPYQHVQYDMSKYNWDKIAQQVAEVYRGL